MYLSVFSLTSFFIFLYSLDFVVFRRSSHQASAVSGSLVRKQVLLLTLNEGYEIISKIFLLVFGLIVKVDRTVNFISKKISWWRFLKNWFAGINRRCQKKNWPPKYIFYKRGPSFPATATSRIWVQCGSL